MVSSLSTISFLGLREYFNPFHEGKLIMRNTKSYEHGIFSWELKLHSIAQSNLSSGYLARHLPENIPLYKPSVLRIKYPDIMKFP